MRRNEDDQRTPTVTTAKVSDLWTGSRLKFKHRPIAVFCSDLHLCHNKPACREPEPNWYEAMDRHLSQLRRVCDFLGDLPCLIAGDLFDRWNAPAELIHFAMDALPKRVIAIPGQHDLPNHDTEQMFRSAFGVLVKSGRIEYLSDQNVYAMLGAIVHGYGWNKEVDPNPDIEQYALNVAIIHRYCWKDIDTVYHKSAMELKTSARNEELQHYDVAIFGDNHIPFCWRSKEQKRIVVNCGAFIPRTTKEVQRASYMYLLLQDGSVCPLELDTSKNLHTNSDQEFATVSEALDLKELETLLKGSTLDGLDYQKVVMDLALTNNVSNAILAKLMEALQHGTPKS